MHNDNDFQKWLDTVMRKSSNRLDHHAGHNVPCIHISDDRYAQHATFEDRLSLEDKQLLAGMGIGL
jgi:hypothetical protein